MIARGHLPVGLRRSWVFTGAANPDGFASAWAGEADAVIACLEDGTPPSRRPEARGLLARFVHGCRTAGKTACVRINPLDGDGRDDLEAALAARPNAILLPKTESPLQVTELAALVERGPDAGIELVPNIETAIGLVRTLDIAGADPRVSACLIASEDMTTSLAAERGRDGEELRYARARFLVECRAAGVVPIDCPYTFNDVPGLEAETRMARRLGFPAKSAVDASHAAVINRVLTPGQDEVERARRIIREFERAHAEGRRAEVDGNFLEVPIYTNAKRLVARHDALSAARRSG